MARSFLVPDNAELLTATGSVNDSSGAYAWLSLTAPTGNSVCGVFCGGSVYASACTLWVATVAACCVANHPTPFKCPAGVHVSLSGTGVCAVVALMK